MLKGINCLGKSGTIQGTVDILGCVFNEKKVGIAMKGNTVTNDDLAVYF